MKECFGSIYPDMTRIQHNKDMTGTVFSIRIDSHGMVHQAPRLKIDTQAWEDCQLCESYQSCFDFSNAKLAIGQALRSIP